MPRAISTLFVGEGVNSRENVTAPGIDDVANTMLVLAPESAKSDCGNGAAIEQQAMVANVRDTASSCLMEESIAYPFTTCKTCATRFLCRIAANGIIPTRSPQRGNNNTMQKNAPLLFNIVPRKVSGGVLC